MAALINRCMFRAQAGGTADFVENAAIAGYLSLQEAGADTSGFTEYPYAAETDDKAEWEIGYGSSFYDGLNYSFVRHTIIKSSNANAKVNFTLPPKVMVTPLAADLEPSSKLNDGSAQVNILGGSSGITTGLLPTMVQVGYDSNLTGIKLYAETTGSIQIDIWNAPYANFPPTVANTIFASDAVKPKLVNQRTASFTPNGWLDTFNRGDVLFFNVDSVDTVNQVTLVLELSKRL